MVASPAERDATALGVGEHVEVAVQNTFSNPEKEPTALSVKVKFLTFPEKSSYASGVSNGTPSTLRTMFGYKAKGLGPGPSSSKHSLYAYGLILR